MAGSSWPALVAGAKAKASEVEAKFDWVEGDIVPMTGGTKTDATYDLGESSFRWRDVRFSRVALGGNGSVSAPTYSFSAETNSGWYKAAAGDVQLTITGTQVLKVTTGGVTCVTGQFFAPNGTNTNPSYSFTSETNSGWRRVGAGDIQLVVSGSQVLKATTGGVTAVVGQFLAFSNVNAATPDYSWTGDENSGLYRIGADNIALATAGNNALVITSAGEITMPLQPAFLAFLDTTSVNNINSGSTLTTVILEAEVFDRGSDFNTSTYTFTAPVTGLYLFNAQVTYDDLTTTVSGINLFLVTSNRSYGSSYDSFTFSAGTGQPSSISLNVIADMDAADTASLGIQFGSGVNQDIIGQNTTYLTFLSGCLLA